MRWLPFLWPEWVEWVMIPFVVAVLYGSVAEGGTMSFPPSVSFVSYERLPNASDALVIRTLRWDPMPGVYEKAYVRIDGMWYTWRAILPIANHGELQDYLDGWLRAWQAGIEPEVTEWTKEQLAVLRKDDTDAE